MEIYHVATMICVHVGAFKYLIPHTEMSHICFQREYGLLMVSRFWIDQRAKLILRDSIAKEMAEHCGVKI